MLSNKAKIAAWAALLQWARVGINAIVFLVLSRWLSLAEIGTVAAVQAPIIVIQTLFTSMLPDFVVQERFPSQYRLSSLFWVSCTFGALLSTLLIILSPIIAAGINDLNAQHFLLALSICPFAWSLSSVFEGILRKQLQIKQLALRTALSSGVAAIVAIAAGYSGLGGWSIVLFTLISTVISSAITMLTCEWRPKRQYSRRYIRASRTRILALGGRYLLGAAALPVIQYATTWQLDTTAGGIFQISVRIYTLVDSVVMVPYRFVVMPLFARARHGSAMLADRVGQATRIGSLIASPAHFGLIAVAPVLLPILLGPRNGLPCVTTVQLLCFHGALSSLSSVVNQVLTARGYSSVVFRRSLWMYALAIAPAILATLHSVQAVAAAFAIIGGLSGFILTLLLAKNYLDIDAIIIAGGWLRPFLASTSLMLLSLISMLATSFSFLQQLLIMITTAPLVFLPAAWLIAPTEIKLLLEVARNRRPQPQNIHV